MIWCSTIFGVMALVYGIVAIRDARAGKAVSNAHYKNPKMLTGRAAVAMGIGYIVLGVVVVVGGYFLLR